MNLFKRTILALLTGIFPSLALAKLNVITTTTDLAAIATEVGGDLVDVVSLAKGYQDPHFVEAKPSHLLKLRKADLFVQVGLELEISWAPTLLTNARNPKILPSQPGFLDASQGCEILDRPAGQVSRAEGDTHPFGNPHYWLDPGNGRVIARNIAKKLAELDPSHKPDFDRNLEKFEAALKAKEAEWDKNAAPLQGAKVIFYHNAWSNFAKRFGLIAADFIEPKPGIPPSPAHVRALERKIREQNIKVLLVDPYFDTKLPEKIARDTGAKLIIFPPSVGAVKEVATYFDLFDYNLNVLLKAIER